jgi:tetratricopeptide (TPR) repeat protein
VIGEHSTTFAFASILGLALAANARSSNAEPSPTAEQLYDHGQAAYSAKDYDTAISMWTRSYELSHADGLLFNLAQAHRLRARSGDCARARDAYESFIAQAADSPQRALAVSFAAQMATCVSHETTASPVTAVPSQLHDSAARSRDVGITIGSVGVVSFVTGLGLGHHASVLSNRVTRACAVSCDWESEKSTDDAGHRDATLGYALDAIGAIAIVSGAALLYLGAREGETRQPPVSVQVQATSVSLSMRGSW